MGTGIVAWFLTTPMGRTVAAALLISLSFGLSWWAFSDHYYDKGVDACNASHAKKQNDANTRQAALNNQSNATSSTVANAADKAGATVTAKVEKAVTEGKENVRIIYRDAPRTAPIALGSCVHPVDKRVQSRLEAARSAANGAAGNP